MGQAGIGAGYHNGIEGQPLRTIFIHTVNQLRLGFQLGHAHLQPGQHLQECSVGNLLCLAQTFQLPLLFDIPEGTDFLVIRNHLGIQALLEAAALPCRHVFFLISQGVNAKICNGLIDQQRIVAVAVRHDDLKIVNVIGCGLNVAAVGKIAAALLGDNCHALGNVELRAVMTAVAGSQQQTVHLVIQNGQVLFKIFHFRFSCSLPWQ